MSKGDSDGLQPWIPFFGKLIWPFFVAMLLVFYQAEVRDIVSTAVERIKAGGEFEIAGVFALGEAANATEIGKISPDNIDIEAIGGAAGAVRKGSPDYLRQLQDNLDANPNLSIDTLLIVDGPTYSTELVRQYISTLGLRYVLFASADGVFQGWMSSSVLAAQIPPGETWLSYAKLTDSVAGIRREFVSSDQSSREVLLKMQELRVAALPVLDENKRWLFFVEQGQILSRLMTGLLVEGDR